MRPLFLLTLGICVLCAPARAEWDLTLLPKGRPFRLTFADPRELRMSISFESESRVWATVGNYFSLAEFRPHIEDTDGWWFHLGFEGAGYFSMRREDSRFPLETVDGLVGLYVDGARGPWQTQLRYTHISAHFADGLALQPSLFSRETLILRGAYVPRPNVQIYAGVHALVHTIPTVPAMAVQVGGAYFLDVGLQRLAPFTAIDYKWRADTDQHSSVHFLLGIGLLNEPEYHRSFRFYYSYFVGADPRGQFFLRRYESHSFGIEMQI